MYFSDIELLPLLSYAYNPATREVYQPFLTDSEIAEAMNSQSGLPGTQQCVDTSLQSSNSSASTSPSTSPSNSAHPTPATEVPPTYQKSAARELKHRRSSNKLIHIHIGDPECHVQSDASPDSASAAQEELDRRLKWAQEMILASPPGKCAKACELPALADFVKEESLPDDGAA